jgi:hypothetical protein
MEQIQADQYIETLAHSVNESGTYYVRVELYTDIAVDSFKLIVKVNDEVVRTEYDSAINPSFPISIRQFNTTTDCFAAVEYTGPALPIMVFPPGSNTTTPPSYVFTSSTFEFPLGRFWGMDFSPLPQHHISNRTHPIHPQS